MMQTFFLDLHVHIGRDGDGKAVKITASPLLTLPNILRECLERKGIDMVGIIDCGSRGVLADLKKLVASGELVELEKGGWRYQEKITLFAGVELETVERNGGRAHHLCYFPNLTKLEDFAGFIWQKVKNNQLSSQVCYLSAHQLWQEVKKRQGLFIPAHVFTPYKSLYGNCAAFLQDIFGDDAGDIQAIELGLSADREMALLIPELVGRNFLANSDAHSLEKIGREYNQVAVETPCFADLAALLSGQKGRIIANYGLDPKLGKYHRSFCNKCNQSMLQIPPVFSCPVCGEQNDFVVGVLDRIMSISRLQHDKKLLENELLLQKQCVNEHNGKNIMESEMLESNKMQREIPESRYCYQIPLNFIPGLGQKTKEKLLSKFGTEMAILHRVSEDELREIVGGKLASLIIRARRGALQMTPGAGGIYGRIVSL